MDAAGDGVGFQADEGDSRGGVQESKPQREGPGPRRGAGRDVEVDYPLASPGGGGDTVARRYREAVGVTEAMIDIYFGWQERVLKRAMQVHYAAMSIRERMATAVVTGMM